MKVGEKLITGWGLFGTARGIVFEGLGALEIGESDPINDVFDSGIGRSRYSWRECLSLHRCAEEQKTLIFTIRQPVLDAGGSPGFCSVAVAVEEEVCDARKSGRAELMKRASDVLKELVRDGVQNTGRFSLEGRALRRFVEARKNDLTFKSSPFGPSSGKSERLVVANSGWVDYVVDRQAWEVLRNDSNWAQLAFAQGEANYYVYFAEGDSKISGASRLVKGDIHGLLQNAADRRQRSLRKQVEDTAQSARGADLARAEAVQSKPQVRRQESTAQDLTESSSKELKELKQEVGRLKEGLQRVEARIGILGQDISTLKAREVSTKPAAPTRVARETGASYKIELSKKTRTLLKDLGILAFALLSLGIVCWFGIRFFRSALKNQELRTSTASSCTPGQLENDLRDVPIKLSAQSSWTASDSIDLGRALNCSIQVGRTSPADCRLIERGMAAQNAFREMQTNPIPATRDRLKVTLLDIVTELQNCKVRAK